ncbi:MAG: hypothetical protein IIV19_01865 [Bacteroidaceae bacterium]|nr:hypothetical protein [Bacteroidaceae bacterium]
MKNKEYLDKFEEKLREELVLLCTSYSMLDGNLLATMDIEERWNDFAPEYVADAIKEVASYPTVSVAWAAFIGLAVAHYWDANLELFKNAKYSSFYGENGFDDMDEFIMYKILKFSPEDRVAKDFEETIRRCAEKTVNMIRHEQVEPQSPMAFHIFARSIKIMYRVGVALELRRLGYKLELVNLPQC